MKNLKEWVAVQELHKRKVPKLKIEKQLGISRNTVKKLIELKEEPKYTREHYATKVDPYMDLIRLWRTSPEFDFNGTRIFRELKARGYTGTINPVYRALKKIDGEKGGISPAATVRIETPPGDQAQFDWAHYEMKIAGRIRTVYCFSMILAACRKKAICFSLSSNSDSIYEAIQELFEDLGGITLELIIDNPKTLVVENNPKGEEKCPHADEVQPVIKEINEADLLILESPCYVYGMSGQLKTFLDHLAYRWMAHRPYPKMFNKVGLVVSTAAGAGTKKVTRSLKDNLFHWGIPKIYRYGKNVGASSWETVKAEKKLKIEKEVKKISSQIEKQIGRAKPGLKTKTMFLIMRLGQKANDWNPTDKKYWLENGWLDSNRPW